MWFSRTENGEFLSFQNCFFMLLVATMRFDQLKLQFNQQTKNKSAKRKVVPAINMVTF